MSRKNTNLNDLLVLRVNIQKIRATHDPAAASSFRTSACAQCSKDYNKKFHQNRGKNSLDVIGHTHTSGLCLSPIRHSGGVCGPGCGASQSVCTGLFFSFFFFFTTLKCAPALQIISLAEQQHSHRPGSPIYLLYEEELTLKESKKVDFFLNSTTSCRQGRVCENGAQLTRLFSV